MSGRKKSEKVVYERLEDAADKLKNELNGLEGWWGSSTIDVFNEFKDVIIEVGKTELYPSRDEDTVHTRISEVKVKQLAEKLGILGYTAKKMHEEIIQNIESTGIRAINEGLIVLDQVNEGKNTYKANNLTKDVTHTVPSESGYGEPMTYTTKEPLTLDEVMAGNSTNLTFVKDYYQEKLKNLKEMLANNPEITAEQREQLKNMSDEELKQAFFYTGQIGEVADLCGTWYDENKHWLGWLEMGVDVIGGIAATIAAPFTGGISLLVYAGYVGGKLALSALNGNRNIFTGQRMQSSDYILGAVEIVLSVIPGLGMLDDVAKGVTKAGTFVTKVATKVANIGSKLSGLASQMAKIGYQGMRTFANALKQISWLDNAIQAAAATAVYAAEGNMEAVAFALGGAAFAEVAGKLLSKIEIPKRVLPKGESAGVGAQVLKQLQIVDSIDNSLDVDLDIDPRRFRPEFAGRGFDDLAAGTRRKLNEVGFLVGKEGEDMMDYHRYLNIELDSNRQATGFSATIREGIVNPHELKKARNLLRDLNILREASPKKIVTIHYNQEHVRDILDKTVEKLSEATLNNLKEQMEKNSVEVSDYIGMLLS